MAGKPSEAAMVKDADKEDEKSYSLPVVIVVSLAVFTDDYIYASVIPILPFLLEDQLGFRGVEVQECMCSCTWKKAMI